MPLAALAGLVFGMAACSVSLYHALFIAPRLRAILLVLEGDGAGGDSLVKTRDAQARFAKRTEERLAELERVSRREVHRVGFVRYNSFHDADSDLSFTLALLNNEGDGVVLTSIYAQDETRTYGQAVRKFVPHQGASQEEQAAIAMARAGSAA
jgi:Protein of unknown function (DUF4446)